MTRVLLSLAVLFPAAAAFAQEEFVEASVSAAQRTYDQLLEQQRVATANYNFAVRALEHTEAYEKALEARDRAKLTELRSGIERPDTEPLIEKFQAAAEKYAGQPAELDFLLWLAGNATDGEMVGSAVDALLERYIGSEKLGDLMERYFVLSARLGPERADEVMDRIANGSPHDEVRAWALYGHAQTIQRNRNATEEQKMAAATLVAQATELAPEGSILAKRLAGPTFEAERLQIGMEAPDIVGEDLDGVPFKLSDYRGKVVVLDFWGDW